MSYVAVAAVYESAVAPFTGAWIEMSSTAMAAIEKSVAPFTGAWIEIWLRPFCTLILHRRSLHGSVD